MPPQHSRGPSPSGNRTLALVATALWVVVAVLAAAFFLTGSSAGAADPAGGGMAEGTSLTQGPTTTLLADTTTSAPSTISSSTSASSSTTTSSSTTSTSSTTTSSTLPPSLTVAAGGDVLGDRGVGLYMDQHGGPAVLDKVRPFLETSHLAFVNLECPISDKGTAKAGKEYTFRGRTVLAQGLVSAGIDVVSLANNHVLDYGQQAFLDTIRRLDAAGVAHAGAGADSSAAAAPALLITPAGTVAFLAFTEIIPSGFVATSKTGGINPITQDRKKMLADIAAAAKTVDFVIVSVHWGIEYADNANQSQRTLAHQMVDAGADLILGHHPHVIQGLELYKDRLIAYSLGDFVFDHYSRRTGEAFVLQVSIPAEGPPSIEVVPVYLNDSTGVPGPVDGEAADVILQRLIRLSAPLGLDLIQLEDRVRLPDPG